MLALARLARLSVPAALALACGLSGGIARAAAVSAQPGDEPAVALTIYSSAAPGAIPPEWYRPTPNMGYGPRIQPENLPGYALIKQVRTVAVPQGRGGVQFDDVAAYIDPTTVSFESITDPDGTRVLEQGFRFDLVDPGKLLRRRLGAEVLVDGRPYTLLGVHGNSMVLRDADQRISFVEGLQRVTFDAATAEGMVIRPTLSWDIASQAGGEQRVRVSYQTGGLTWWADYIATLTPTDDANRVFLDLGAWVSILNQSGASYEDAQLKLVAGEVNRVQPQQYGYGMSPFEGTRSAMANDAAGFAEKSFFEYHLYTLGRPTTVEENATKQIELFPVARRIAAEKILLLRSFEGGWWGGGRYDDPGFQGATEMKAAVYVKFDNAEAAGLGMPLPRGRVRVSQRDPADGSLEFIGEDAIDHTPREEAVLLKLGEAFDVVGERRQVSFQRGKDWMVETVEVAVRNRKREAVTVVLQEVLYRWVNAEITQTTHQPEMADARTARFTVRLAPDEEQKITYTVRYSW